MVLSSVTLSNELFNPKKLTVWADLKADFLSQGLRVIDPKDSEYAIVRYERKTEEVNGWMRSVVYKKETCRPVCVAPPKSTTFTGSLENYTVQEFVDGTMINLFWMPGDEQPQVVTRSRLGADNKFYSELSFLDMLKEAVNGVLNNLKPYPDTYTTSAQFVSVVLQHPQNRVVTLVSKPRVTVVHMGIVTDDHVNITEDPNVWSGNIEAYQPTVYNVPKEHLVSLEALASYVETFAKEDSQSNIIWQGVVVKDGLGRRCRLRSKTYSQVRSLRGNESDTVVRFCRLRNTRLIKRYLQHYPEDEKIFYELEGKLRKVTRHIFDLYMRTFKFKKEEFYTLPWPYKHHVSVIHNLFKEKLKPVRKTIDMDFMIEYILGLSVEDMSNLFKKPSAPTVPAPTVSAPTVSAPTVPAPAASV